MIRGELSEVEEIVDGLMIRITPIKAKEHLPSVDRRHRGISTGQISGARNRGQANKASLLLAEEEEADYYGYKNLPVRITGDTKKRATNIMLVNGVEVFIGDVSLALFLRLLVELFKNKRGTISRSKLMNTGFIKTGSEFQSVSRLRDALRPALSSVSAEEFIETCEHKSIRLSANPALISYDRGKLLHHRNVASANGIW